MKQNKAQFKCQIFFLFMSLHHHHLYMRCFSSLQLLIYLIFLAYFNLKQLHFFKQLQINILFFDHLINRQSPLICKILKQTLYELIYQHFYISPIQIFFQFFVCLLIKECDFKTLQLFEQPSFIPSFYSLYYFFILIKLLSIFVLMYFKLSQLCFHFCLILFFDFNPFSNLKIFFLFAKNTFFWLQVISILLKDLSSFLMAFMLQLICYIVLKIHSPINQFKKIISNSSSNNALTVFKFFTIQFHSFRRMVISKFFPGFLKEIISILYILKIDWSLIKDMNHIICNNAIKIHLIQSSFQSFFLCSKT
ncbi:hypothetical protein ABPG72_002628 [Tetrahymena utriculariae]